MDHSDRGGAGPPGSFDHLEQRRISKPMTLTTKHQILALILMSQGIHPHLNNNPTLKDLQRGLEFRFSKHLSIRQIRSHLARLESQGIIHREINAWRSGRYGNQAQATRYVIPDLERALQEIPPRNRPFRPISKPSY